MIRTTAQAIAARLRQWWRLQTCSGSIHHLTQDSAAAHELAAARGVDVSALQSEDLQILKCRKLHKHCQACPRLQAYRQSFTTREDRSRDLHMGGTIVSIKPDVGNGYREGAEVDRSDKDARRSVTGDTMIDINANAHPVAVERAPRVDDAEHGADRRDCERDGLKQCGIHASIVQRGHALPTVTAWLAGITVALLIAASINLDIDDHSAEVAQAADIEHAHQAAEARQRFARSAQAMCGPQSPWSEPAPGVVQCHNKHGRKTVIAQGVTP